jgi:RTX calcium-binding nonapeptide repeat (4 copies)
MKQAFSHQRPLARKASSLLALVGVASSLTLSSSVPAQSTETKARVAEASHAGWPQVNGMLLLNAGDENRPLDGRPGYGPFDGKDPTFSCNGVANFTRCLRGGPEPLRFGPPQGPHLRCHAATDTCWRQTVPANIGHNELLGGHGNDTIHAGPAGDVIWGDYKPSGQPESQIDHLYGAAGNDWIYSSHGTNYIWSGAGNDHIQLVYGHGVVYCNGPGHKTLVMRKLPSNRHYRLVGCTSKTIIPYAA